MAEIHLHAVLRNEAACLTRRQFDYGAAETLDRFYSADLLVLDISEPRSHMPLVYHVAIREALGRKDTLLVAHEVLAPARHACTHRRQGTVLNPYCRFARCDRAFFRVRTPTVDFVATHCPQMVDGSCFVSPGAAIDDDMPVRDVQCGWKMTVSQELVDMAVYLELVISSLQPRSLPKRRQWFLQVGVRRRPRLG